MRKKVKDFYDALLKTKHNSQQPVKYYFTSFSYNAYCALKSSLNPPLQ